MIGRGVITVLLLTGCGIDVHHRPEQRWVGQVTPLSDPSHCPPTRAVLVLRENEVKFAPDEGVWVLDGNAHADTIEAAQSRMNADHKSYETRLQAKRTEQSIEGTYTTPACTYRVNLKRF